MLGNWGYDRLAEKYRTESIDEMKDADELIERILYLDGMPNLQRLSTLRVGETVTREAAGRARPRERVDRAPQPRHRAVRRQGRQRHARDAREILEGEEEFADWLETQLELIRQVGENLYLSQQIHD